MKELNRKAIGLTVLMLLAGMLAATAYAADSPTFFVQEEQVDLGEFFEGNDIEYEFTVRNNGVGELHINNVKPG
ncbi:MAG TPA: hypothetical protein VLA34_05085 [Candidatus Krumholzibacterium sp.]|nr:hypothetical protein [Candidatus Krumholzibacterium sp.]